MSRGEEPPGAPRIRRRGPFGVALRALAGATCTGAAWASSLLLLAPRPAGVIVLTFRAEPPERQYALLLALALSGAVVGGAVGLVAGVVRRRLRGVRRVAFAAAVGAVGGGASVPVMLASAPPVDPLVRSALLWGVVGALAGARARGGTATDEREPFGRGPMW